MSIDSVKYLIGKDRILGKPIEVETKQDKSGSNLYLPEEVKKKQKGRDIYEDHPSQVEILAMTDDMSDVVSVGDRIAHRPNSGEWFLCSNEMYLLLSRHELYLVYK